MIQNINRENEIQKEINEIINKQILLNQKLNKLKNELRNEFCYIKKIPTEMIREILIWLPNADYCRCLETSRIFHVNDNINYRLKEQKDKYMFYADDMDKLIEKIDKKVDKLNNYPTKAHCWMEHYHFSSVCDECEEISTNGSDIYWNIQGLIESFIIDNAVMDTKILRSLNIILIVLNIPNDSLYLGDSKYYSYSRQDNGKSKQKYVLMFKIKSGNYLFHIQIYRRLYNKQDDNKNKKLFTWKIFIYKSNKCVNSISFNLYSKDPTIDKGYFTRHNFIDKYNEGSDVIYLTYYITLFFDNLLSYILPDKKFYFSFSDYIHNKLEKYITEE